MLYNIKVNQSQLIQTTVQKFQHEDDADDRD